MASVICKMELGDDKKVIKTKVYDFPGNRIMAFEGDTQNK